MPDLFAGDNAPISTAITDDSSSLIGQVKLQAVGVVKSFFIDMWLARVTPDKVMPILHKVIEAAQDQYADDIKNGEGIYAVGYCVGGRFVLLLAQETDDHGGDEETGALKKGPYIKAGALAHGASVTPSDFNNLKAPLSLVCVEKDNLFSDEVRTVGEDAMSRANLEHEVQVYPGVPHGTIRLAGISLASWLTGCRVCCCRRVCRHRH
jgi:dienelactone hydrolase